MQVLTAAWKEVALQRQETSVMPEQPELPRLLTRQVLSSDIALVQAAGQINLGTGLTGRMPAESTGRRRREREPRGPRI